MGRPPRHDADKLLDAAVGLVAEGGPRAVTMAAVARAARAPSGSVYHRFPDQPALLAELWLRTVTRFQAGFLAALDSGGPVAGARHVVEWSRRNVPEARVLLAGARAFGEPDWPQEARDRLAAANEEVFAAMRRLGAELGFTRKREMSRFQLAVVDLPYAVVRRNLLRGEEIPAFEADVAADAARDLLG
ncbi:TetR/AcrR family transcriptional regulator [Saccharopolyspora taberi]|uniref:TetR/AcrR family transcriptional regulator n=1 Tax=Saccharopolyspora taberi TaxID=60895 RepID=A0ABN3VLY7_9PSEU